MLLLIAFLLSLSLGIAAFVLEWADEAGLQNVSEVRHATQRR